MFELDPRTLFIWLVLSEALFALLLGLIWSVRRTEKAMLYWMATSLCVSLGCLGIGLRGTAPDWASIVLANLLLQLGWSLRWAGMRQFAGQPPRGLWYLLPPLGLGLLFHFREALQLGVAERVLILGVISFCYSTAILIDALRAQRQERLLMRYAVIVGSGLAALFNLARCATALSGNMADDLMAPGGAFPLILLGQACIAAVFNLSCFMMVFERHERRLSHAATVDTLTDTLNRAGFNELAERQVARCRQDSQRLSVLVMDLDFFKAINDRHGHLAGDAVLTAFARSVGTVLRPTDLLSRPGGEEFWALLPDTELAAAHRVAQRICDECQAMRVRYGGSIIQVTVSVGVAQVSVTTETLHTALARADAALYAAKRAGRNQVCSLPTTVQVAA